MAFTSVRLSQEDADGYLLLIDQQGVLAMKQKSPSDTAKPHHPGIVHTAPG